MKHKNETLSDISMDIRSLANRPYDVSPSVCHPTFSPTIYGMPIQDYLRELADRIDAAGKRTEDAWRTMLNSGNRFERNCDVGETLGGNSIAADVIADLCDDPSIADEVRRNSEDAGEPRPVNMREALEICRDEIADLLTYWGPFDDHVESKLKELVIKCDAGLSSPRRNCDIGTAEEQTHRFDRHCDKYLLNRDEDEECVGCPLVNMAGHCELNWAQMPYESEAGK